VVTILTIISDNLFSPLEGNISCFNTDPYHHDMALPRVLDGGDGFQIRRIAVNILNEHSWLTEKG
jgi:hypothetical protein